MQADTRPTRAPTTARVRSMAGGDAPRGIASSHRKPIAATGAFALVAAISLGRFFTASTDPAGNESPSVAVTIDSTIERLERTVAAQPQDGRSWHTLATAYMQKLVQSSNPAYAELSRHALDQADTLVANDVASTVTRAQLALALHQFDDARRLAVRARALSSSNNDALVVLVDANVELGRYDDAAASLQSLLDHKPGLAASTRVSYLRELHGDIGGALVALREAQNAAAGASAFDRATINAIRGDLLFTHGQVDEAAAAYDAALVLSPGQLVATAGRARVLVARGDLAGASTALAPVAARTPTPTLVSLLGDIAMLDGRSADATSSFDLVRATTKLQAASGAAIDLEAALFEADHDGSPAVAVALAKQAYESRPSIHAADAYAWALHRAGENVKAAALVDEALRLGTRDASLYFHAAAIHEATGATDRAGVELRTALAINPWFAIGNRGEVSSLAQRLTVPVPVEWGPR